MKRTTLGIMTTVILACTGLMIGFYAFAGNKTFPDPGNSSVPAVSQKGGTEKSSLDQLAVATFAGGCFWCTESDFEKRAGVKAVISGYTGGHDTAPSYASVSGGKTGHAEAIQVYYDSNQVTYAELLDLFWRHIDPTDPGGQFVDRGSQYRSEIFTHDSLQQEQALASKRALEASGVFDKPIVTPITRFEKFYRAEEYHQDYYKKSAVQYKYYRWRSGRDQFLEKAWKAHPMKEKSQMKASRIPMEKSPWSRPAEAKIRETLTPLQYRVTREDGTEPPFQNRYWDNKKEGIYVDIVSGEPLFSSTDKFKSGTGWPSFTRPLEPDHVVEKTDQSLFMVRTEVRSRYGDSHLGHLFEDGPMPTGLRYCINSASLRFIPKEKLSDQGYGQYADRFK